MLRNLLTFVLRSRVHAIAVSVVLAFLPLLQWASIAIGACVTMRRGAKEGAVCLFGAALIVWGIEHFTGGEYQALLPYVIILQCILILLPIWGLSIVLRSTASLNKVVQLGAMIIFLLVLGFYLLGYLPTSEQWYPRIMAQMKEVFGESGIQGVDQDTMVQSMALLIATGWSAFLYIFYVFVICVARSWQATLYHPGGFRAAFHNISLDKRIVCIMVLLGMSLSFAEIPLVLNLLASVAMCVLVLPGISLVHWVIAEKSYNRLWLILFYILLFSLMPFMVLVTAVLGTLDTFMNFRKRMKVALES